MIPARFAQALDKSIIGFFKDNCSVDVKSTEVADIQVTSKASVVATLGFTGNLVKGTLLIVGRTDSLRTTHPMTAMGADVTDNDLSDWGGEISNQVLGRFKNAMLPYGIDLKMSVPSVVRGTEMQLAGVQGGDRILRGVRGGADLVFGVALVVMFVRGYDATVIDTMEPAGDSTKKEGDGFFF